MRPRLILQLLLALAAVWAIRCQTDFPTLAPNDGALPVSRSTVRLRGSGFYHNRQAFYFQLPSGVSNAQHSPVSDHYLTCFWLGRGGDAALSCLSERNDRSIWEQRVAKFYQRQPLRLAKRPLSGSDLQQTHHAWRCQSDKHVRALLCSSSCPAKAALAAGCLLFCFQVSSSALTASATAKYLALALTSKLHKFKFCR